MVHPRAEAARVGGTDRQTLRDWVIRFNELGPEGLIKPGLAWRAAEPGPDSAERRDAIPDFEAQSPGRYPVVGQWRVVVVGTEPITDAIPSVSIVFKASASAALSVGKGSFQTVEFPNSSTTSSSHPAFPSS